jgi:hypothetical protein
MKFDLLSFFKNAGAAGAHSEAAAQKPATQPATEPTAEPAKVEKNMSSLFAKIEGAEKSTAAWIEKKLTEIEGKEPAVAKVIDTVLTYVTPALKIALAATGDPAAAAVVGEVAAQAETDLSVASALVTDFGPTPTAATAFASVATNLGGLLTAGHVKSSTAVAAVTKAVTEVGVLASAVQTAATAIAASAAPATA